MRGSDRKRGQSETVRVEESRQIEFACRFQEREKKFANGYIWQKR